nr:squalene/phytoene synthase family protein [Planctomycetota bacterium]
MDFRHSRRFAAEQAKLVCGDLYPGPILMPRGLLRALDPVIAVALGPANDSSDKFTASFEDMLRGRPDGPLLLALWASTTSGEIPHDDLRKILKYFPDQLPECPDSRGEMLAFLHPRVSIIACCTLSLAQRRDADALPAAERLGLGLVLTKLLIDLPQHLAAGKLYFPLSDLQQANLSEDD